MALHPGDEESHPPDELALVWGPLRQNPEESKDWYRDLVEHSHDLLCVHDLEGRLLSVNPVPARLLGYSVKEMLRMRLSDFIDPQFRDQCPAYLRETERAGESQGLMAVVARSGQKRIWEYHSTLRTEGLATPIVRTIAHDVTERVRAEKALRQSNERLLATALEQERMLQGLTLFRTLLDQSNDAFQVIDSGNMRFLDVNEKACIDLGYSREELLSMTIFDIDKDLDESSRASMEQRIREAGFVIAERVHWRKNGTSFPVEVNCRRVHLDREYCVVVTRDITERKRAAEALQTTNDELTKALREQAPILRELTLFRTLLDQSNDAVKVIDPETLRFLDANERSYRELGYSREELLSMTVFDIDPNADESLIAWVRQQLRESGFAVMETVHRRQDGTTFPVEVNMRQVQTDREYVVSISRDITERKRAEERLREFEKVVENLEEMIVVVNRDRRYLLANRAALRYRGMSKEQLIGRHVTEVVQPELYEMTVKGKLDESFAGHIVTYEGQSEYPGLGVRDIACTYLPIEGPTGIDRVACVLRDVTERNQAEEALRTSEREQHKIAEQLETERARLVEAQAVAKVGSWEIELPSLDITWSEQTHRIFETDPSNFHPRRPGFMELVHPEDRAKVNAVFEASLENGAPSTVEYRIVMTDGRVKVLEEHWKVFQDGQGRPARLVGTCQDITERKGTEEALRVSEAREREKAKELETILDTLPVQVVIAHDPQLRHVTANRAGRALLHLEPGASLTLRPAPGEKLQMRYWRDGIEIPTGELPMERAIATGQLVQGVATDVVLADGTTTYQMGNAAPLLDDWGNVRGAVGASIDLTELRLAEQALRESELHFRTVFERSPLGIALVDSRSGRFMQCNPKFCEIVGREEKEVLQLDIPSITHPDDIGQGSEYQRQLVEEKLASYEMNKRYVRPDGSARWVRILAVPMWSKGENATLADGAGPGHH
jgi:PAS domain S-box-containing protein